MAPKVAIYGTIPIKIVFFSGKEVKVGQTGPNTAKQVQTGLNGVKQAKRGQREIYGTSLQFEIHGIRFKLRQID